MSKRYHIVTVNDVYQYCVVDGDCILWQGAVNSSGYPVMRYKKQMVLVTRWVLSHRRRFKKKELACHICDRSRCVKLEHLYHGTHSKNLRDAWHRKRRCRPSTFVEE